MKDVLWTVTIDGIKHSNLSLPGALNAAEGKPKVDIHAYPPHMQGISSDPYKHLKEAHASGRAIEHLHFRGTWMPLLNPHPTWSKSPEKYRIATSPTTSPSAEQNMYIIIQEKDGTLYPSSTPVKHSSQFAANLEADRLAKAHVGTKFHIFKAVKTSYKPVPKAPEPGVPTSELFREKTPPGWYESIPGAGGPFETPPIAMIAIVGPYGDTERTVMFLGKETNMPTSKPSQRNIRWNRFA